SLFLLPLPPHPHSTLFPYTTLFRSRPSPTSCFSRWSSHKGSLGCSAAAGTWQETEIRRSSAAIQSSLRESLICARLTTAAAAFLDRKSTRLNSSHDQISYAVFCLKK